MFPVNSVIQGCCGAGVRLDRPGFLLWVLAGLSGSDAPGCYRLLPFLNGLLLLGWFGLAGDWRFAWLVWSKLVEEFFEMAVRRKLVIVRTK